MAVSSRSYEPPVGRFGQAALFGLVIAVLGCFAVAWMLNPDPRGFGTHQQLGLPPCTFQLLYRFPCPGCGMTTSFSHFVRGQFASSFHVNPAGFLLASVMTMLVVWSLKSLISGHFWLTSDPMMSATILAASLSVVVVLVWSLKVINWMNTALSSIRTENWC